MNQAERAMELFDRARACTRCAGDLRFGPRPVLRARPSARLLIIGQAPGKRVHDSGIPWNDPSGDRLRQWLGLDRARFYDDRLVAIIPIGLCFPGYDRTGGDAPPRPECRQLWHPRLRDALPDIALTILAGSYAQAYYLGRRRAANLTETVRQWRCYLPEFFPIPHPSWRNNAWLKRNPWFLDRVVPDLRQRIGDILSEAGADGGAGGDAERHGGRQSR